MLGICLFAVKLLHSLWKPNPQVCCALGAKIGFIITALLKMHDVKWIVKSSLHNTCLILFRLVTVLENYNSCVDNVKEF